MKLTLILVFLCLSTFAKMESLRPLPVSGVAIREDLGLIVREARLEEGLLSAGFKESEGPNRARINCDAKQVFLAVEAPKEEWSGALYYALQKLGFLFPHPRIQISPSATEIRSHCGKSFTFRPAFKYRGFHLHTLHPSEWVRGFLMGDSSIANDTVRWLARNSQNIFDLSLVRQKEKKIFKNLKGPFRLARKLGVHPGVALGMAFHQQNSYKLVSLWDSWFEETSVRSIDSNLQNLFDNLDLSFVNLELGTSEFTPVDYDLSIKWMNQAAETAKRNKASVFVKVHVSSNQSNHKYGNFNFLPRYASESVGVLPHSVFFYGLYDEKAPMYGNENFNHIRDFALKESAKRPVWHYPETSYWVAMDVGAPMFYTDYLLSRAKDMKGLYKEQIDGQINFTTGQEAGYWLFDWTVSLLNNREYRFDPLIGLKLLGEDAQIWTDIIKFQKEFLNRRGAVAILSFSNLGDELSSEHRIHRRNTLKDLRNQPLKLKKEILLLRELLKNYPDISEVRNQEFKALLEVMRLRAGHALSLRQAMLDRYAAIERHRHLENAKKLRAEATAIMAKLFKENNRYPQSEILEPHWRNPTAYQFGYLYTAASLHFWKRAEAMVRHDNYSPWFHNIYDALDIVF